MTEPLRYADEYDTEFVGQLRSSLLHAATVLGDVLDHIVVVGGLVPSLLPRSEHAMPRPPRQADSFSAAGRLPRFPSDALSAAHTSDSPLGRRHACVYTLERLTTSSSHCRVTDTSCSESILDLRSAGVST